MLEEDKVLATANRPTRGGARPPSRRPTDEERAKQLAEREALSVQRAAKRALDKRTMQQRLDSPIWLDYDEMAEVLDLKNQTVRDKFSLRKQHIEEDGEAWEGDVPEPRSPFGARPRVPEGEWRAWAIGAGFLSDKDALTPKRPTPPGRPVGSKNKPRDPKDQ